MSALNSPLLGALAALALVLPASDLQAAYPTGLTRLEVQRGRALLVTDHGVQPLGRRSAEQSLDGPGHLELAPGSEAVLRIVGRGSLTLQGPTSISWQAPRDGEELHLSFSALREARVEIRKGGARLDLPGAWRTHLAPGAVTIRSLPGGGTELWNLAGQAARAFWIGGEGFAPPASPIHIGQRARLQGEMHIELAPDHSAGAPRWSESEWPWGEGGIPNVPDLSTDPAEAWGPETWPWDPQSQRLAPWERWDWPWVRVTQSLEDLRALDVQAMNGGSQAPGESTRDFQARPTPRAEPAASADTELGSAPEISTPQVSSTAQPSESAPSPAPAQRGMELDPGEDSVELEPGLPALDDEEFVQGSTDSAEPSVEDASEPSPEPAPEDTSPEQPGGITPEELERLVAGEVEPGSSMSNTESPRSPLHLGPTDLELGFGGSAPYSFQSVHWRGLPAEMLMWNASYALQRSAYLNIELLPSGRRRITLDPAAPKPVWYFDESIDVRLFPGAFLVIEADGSMRYCVGLVRTLARDLRRHF